jgi:hypothetical protein
MIVNPFVNVPERVWTVILYGVLLVIGAMLYQYWLITFPQLVRATKSGQAIILAQWNVRGADEPSVYS